MLNNYFDIEEVKHVINRLTGGKRPGIYSLPPEFVKACEENLAEDLTELYNYMLEKRAFPATWAQGLKSPIHKAGSRDDPTNYRGITILGYLPKYLKLL